MMSREAYLAGSLQLRHLVRAALLGLLLCQLLTARVRAAEEAADPYDVLYDVIMTRDGRSYAEDETSPLIFPRSEFPFGDKTYEKLNAALDAFAALPQSKIVAYSDIKRALLQRHLWKVYDASHPIYYVNRAGKPDASYKNHASRRIAVQPKIGSLIHRLALTRAQILALPNTLTATVKSGGFAESHDPDDLFKPFLPPDLYAKKSSWICQGDAKDPIPADVHSKKFKWRSAFLSFLRAPGGRAETLKCVEKFNRGEALPVGTQSALIEQAFLISNEGEPVLSPLIVSISLRAYVDVMPHPRSRRGGLAAKQCVAEFLIQPRQLMQGNAVMRALTPADHRFEAGDVSGIEGGSQDPFEFAIDAIHPRLRLCIRCHANPGRIGLHTTRPQLLKEVSPKAISKATSAQKRADKTWKALQLLRREDSIKKDAPSSATADQAQPPTDNR